MMSAVKIIKGKVVVRRVIIEKKSKKEYTYYFIQIPKEIAEKLNLRDGQVVGITIYEMEE